MVLDYTRKLHSNFGTTLYFKKSSKMSIFFSKTLPLINYLWVLFQAEQQPQFWIPSCITSENEQEIVFFLYFFPEPQNTARFLSCKAKWVLLKTKMYAIFFSQMNVKKNSS